jgi:hypothetical protein
MMATAWILTKGMVTLRGEFNRLFPNRDKKSDGSVGDLAHQLEAASGHNPDLTGRAEYKDGDKYNEVRAVDIDSDLGDPDVSMEDVAQHLAALGRAGKLTKWVRYFIYNRRIWSASSGWKPETYTGPSAHTEHLHVSGAYSQVADENTDGSVFQLEDLMALSADDKKWITAELTKIVDARVDKVAREVWGFDPGKDSTGSTWPGISDVTYDDPKGNGTVAPGTAVSSLLARDEIGRAAVDEVKTGLADVSVKLADLTSKIIKPTA